MMEYKRGFYVALVLVSVSMTARTESLNVEMVRGGIGLDP